MAVVLRCWRGGNALYKASERGYRAIVGLLLKRGADVNAQGRLHGNALTAASAGGYEAIVKLLLESGADVNMREGVYGTALEAAGRHEAIVELLLKGIDFDVHRGANTTTAYGLRRITRAMSRIVDIPSVFAILRR